MSNNLARNTSVLRASARALGPSNPELELAHQVRDYYLLVYIILSREKCQLVGGLAYGAAEPAPLQNEFGSFTLWRWSQLCPLKARSLKARSRFCRLPTLRNL